MLSDLWELITCTQRKADAHHILCPRTPLPSLPVGPWLFSNSLVQSWNSRSVPYTGSLGPPTHFASGRLVTVSE